MQRNCLKRKKLIKHETKSDIFKQNTNCEERIKSGLTGS